MQFASQAVIGLFLVVDHVPLVACRPFTEDRTFSAGLFMSFLGYSSGAVLISINCLNFLYNQTITF